MMAFRKVGKGGTRDCSLLFGIAFSIALLVVPVVGLIRARPVVAQSNGDMAIQLSGFSVSEAYDLTGGDALDLGDAQLLKLLFRSAKVSSANFEKWSQFSAAVSWQQLLESPPRFRFWTFHRALTLQRLSQLRFASEIATPELKGVYIAQCLDDSGQPVFLMTRSAPRKLRLNQSLDQPIEFTGFFYNTVAAQANPEDGSLKVSIQNRSDGNNGARNRDTVAVAEVPLFIAKRFAWFPTHADSEMAVSAGQIELAACGVDVGLFDDVRQQNSKPFSQHDSDAFYQMLAAARALQSSEPSADVRASGGISFTDLMSAPTNYFGDAITLAGRLRQCVPIEIVDQDRQSQVGVNRYFQVSLFPDLGGRDVVVRTTGNESIRFEQFPITVCVPELPSGMTPGELEGRSAQLEGHFYRFIKYRSKVSVDADQSGQVSPLVIAHRFEVAADNTSAHGVDPLIRVLLLIFFVAFWLAVWFVIARNKNRGGRLAPRDSEALPEKIDLSQFEHQIDD